MNTQVIGYRGTGKKEVNVENLYQYAIHEDLKHFGLIPELLGRLPILTYLDPLTKDMLVEILLKPKNAIIKQYIKLFEYENIKVKVTTEALEHIAQLALDYKLGARGLRSICEAIFMEDMFELPSHKNVKALLVDDEYVKRKLSKSRIKESLKVA